MNGVSAGLGDARGVSACVRMCMRILLVAAALAAVEDAFLPAPASPATLFAGPMPNASAARAIRLRAIRLRAIRLRGGTDARGGGSIPSGDEKEEEEEEEEYEEEEEEDGSIHTVDSADALDAVSVLADWDDKCVMSSANLFSVLCCTAREQRTDTLPYDACPALHGG